MSSFGPCAYLIGNGNAAYFDEYNQQITRWQRHGWKGLHKFVEKYPEAAVYLTNSMKAFSKEDIKYILKQIRKR